MIYLDNNATTRPLPEVVETVRRHLRESYGNPGSRHAAGRTARKVLEQARDSIAAILGADAGEVIFTSGGTEANNLAVFGSARAGGGAIAMSPGEHPSIVEACRRLARQGATLLTIEIDSAGRLIKETYDRLPWDELRLVTIILAHNETGVVQDVAELARRCRERGVWLHLDAVQLAGKMPVDFHELGCTSLSLGAHKFHGPRGVGALLLRAGAELSPEQLGGHQESGKRAGTEPVALVAGMAKALELWANDRENPPRRLSELRNRFEEGLKASCPPVEINALAANRLPNTTNLAFPGVDGEALLVALDLAGVACSLGSACASGSSEPAPVLVAMGRTREIYESSVRFSLGLENTADEIDEAIRRIAEVVRRLRHAASG